MKKTTCCFTGHRPQSLPWGFDENDPRCVKLKALLRNQIERLITESKSTHFITGMALGVDTYAAEIILEIKKTRPVTLECAIPCEDQAAAWREKDRDRYFSIVSRADSETLLQTRYTPVCYPQRNRYIVDESDVVLAVWNGIPGGTAGTVFYARRKGKPVFVIDPSTFQVFPDIVAVK